jgi:hypothetical protein
MRHRLATGNYREIYKRGREDTYSLPDALQMLSNDWLSVPLSPSIVLGWDPNSPDLKLEVLGSPVGKFDSSSPTMFSVEEEWVNGLIKEEVRYE